YKEPRPPVLLFFTFIIGFLILAIVSVVFSLLFGTRIIQNPFYDSTPGIGRKPFLGTNSHSSTYIIVVPLEAVFTALTAGFLGMFVTCFLSLTVLRAKCGVDEEKGQRMYQISTFIAQGAQAFLLREFQILALFVVVVTGALFPTDASGYYVPTPVCFLVGA